MNSKALKAFAQVLKTQGEQAERVYSSLSSRKSVPITITLPPKVLISVAEHIIELDELANLIGLSVDRYRGGKNGDLLIIRCSDCGGVLESQDKDTHVTSHEKWCVYRKALELTGRNI